MTNYFNELAFLDWYDAVSRRRCTNRSALLGEVFRRYCETGKAEFVLAPAETVSGQEERYPFRFENIGCCGASTVYITF